MLKFNNLCKKFRERIILDNISLTLEKGEIALLLGHSGVGKSTLLRAINNLEALDSGDLLLDGKKLDVRSSHQIGMVFQNYHLFDHLTAQQNLSLPLRVCLNKTKDYSRFYARTLLTEYNLSEQANHYPHQMSGGQKQRLAIARAVAMESKLLCMDEPTSALDPQATVEVAEQILHLAKRGHALLIATHDITLIDKFECTIYLMDGGKIVESANSLQFRLREQDYSKIASYLRGVLPNKLVV